MRNQPNLRTSKYKQPDPYTGAMYANDLDGLYFIPRKGVMLRAIASDGLGWEHVSVSTETRCPTWDEMEFIRELFWRDDETVMQLSVPRADHINQHPYCLHWWRPIGLDIPRPDAILVGVPT
jgi:hypothetical protein